MLFNEKEMLKVCRKYGIDVVEKDGYPLYDEQEIDENFSICDIMNDSCNVGINEKIIYSEVLEINIGIDFESNDYANCSSDGLDKLCIIETENNERYEGIGSLMLNNNISIAA